MTNTNSFKTTAIIVSSECILNYGMWYGHILINYLREETQRPPPHLSHLWGGSYWTRLWSLQSLNYKHCGLTYIYYRIEINTEYIPEKQLLNRRYFCIWRKFALTADWEFVHQIYKNKANNNKKSRSKITMFSPQKKNKVRKHQIKCCSWNVKYIKINTQIYFEKMIFSLFCLFVFLPGVGWLWTTWVAGFGVREAVWFTPFSAGAGLGSLLASDGASPWSTWKYMRIYITLSNKQP